MTNLDIDITAIKPLAMPVCPHHLAAFAFLEMLLREADFSIDSIFRQLEHAAGRHGGESRSKIRRLESRWRKFQAAVLRVRDDLLATAEKEG